MLKKSFGRGRRQPTPTAPRRGRQETGDNPPLTPPRRGEMGMSEEVGAKFSPKIVLPNSCLKY
ncbi:MULTISPECIES: hypothetical protein [unclassified Okeania]|uniref:hypothetical protein n=1 Tax=unclassified Okeania TaxID=2634635 RepID=UPI0013BC3DD6|nr:MULTISPECIES: hypothetical protein [unclassified Okeania]NET16668.1 hypothetical protein [Okeania sp. SIO1H6]NES78952.1 hypothetical protein [Okeania sp. SIO1H4]NET22549.1 hypothetical protein [Okeania sp. SIO1H5]NET79468.1 hypothetical protein [Okeania sp. SIO1F9]NET95674.1 hypothetical protein [Okeania sp. SIO1H2]